LILAYGGETTKAERGKYFLAFDSSAYKSVTIGFGSSAQDAWDNGKKATFYISGDVTNGDAGYINIESEKSENVRVVLNGLINGQGWHKPEGYEFDMTAIENLMIFWFDNPHVSGGMQIYLLDFELNA
jgi:hypothetical protein